MISKDDMLSKVDDLNEKNAEWTPEKWWSGRGCQNFVIVWVASLNRGTLRERYE